MLHWSSFLRLVSITILYFLILLHKKYFFSKKITKIYNFTWYLICVVWQIVHPLRSVCFGMWKELYCWRLGLHHKNLATPLCRTAVSTCSHRNSFTLYFTTISLQTKIAQCYLTLTSYIFLRFKLSYTILIANNDY